MQCSEPKENLCECEFRDRDRSAAVDGDALDAAAERARSDDAAPATVRLAGRPLLVRHLLLGALLPRLPGRRQGQTNRGTRLF